MIRVLFILLLAFTSFSVYSQTVNRVEVNGVLLSNNNDLEAITVFNKSSNKGTITNAKGEFKLMMAINDEIEISALQFQTLNVTINAHVIASKQLKIQLVEQVNQLNAVLLSDGLTGNISADVANVKTVKPIILNMGNMNVDYEYNDDNAFNNSIINNHLTSIINPNARGYLPNVGKIIKLIFGSKNDLKIKKEIFVGHKYKVPQDLLSVYSLNSIKDDIKIEEQNLEAFVGFVLNNGVKPELLKPENRILLIQFLINQRELFLRNQNVKN